MSGKIKVDLPERLSEAYEAAKRDPEHVSILDFPEGYIAVMRVFKAGDQGTVLDLVCKHEITASRGAEILGIRYQKFLDLMSKHNIPFIDYEEGELDKDAAILDRVLGKIE